MIKIDWKKKLYKARSQCIARLGKGLIHLLMKTCTIRLEGVEAYTKLAKTDRCLLMLWHNRLAIAPFILSQYTPQILYAALVSGSRDGEILHTWIQSYSNGTTIRVPHQGRYQALREIVRQVEEREKIVIITPDGPRGPLYEMKPGIAVAAIETQANIVSLDWEADKFWELKTWDRLRFPKPFTTIRIKFRPPFKLDHSITLDQAKAALKTQLPT